MADGTKQVDLHSMHCYRGTDYPAGKNVEVPADFIVRDGHDPTVSGPKAVPEPANDGANDPAGDRDGDTGDAGDATPLPDDFPGHDELVSAGVLTIEAVQARLESIEDIDGIGPATSASIRDRLASPADE